jgi:dihydrolipoamide dehydrogenase
MEISQYDVAVIGGGPGGYAAAVRAAELGKRTVLVEADALGGECLNRGCIPTKAMLAASGLYRRLHGAAALGIVAENVRFDYGTILSNRAAIVSRLQSGIRQVLAARKVDIVHGRASFASPNELTVADVSGKSLGICFANSIIATGSEATRPAFLPESPRIVDSTGFLALDSLPASLVILGGGVIGCEFATLAAQLGSSVTLVEQADAILPDVDDDARSLLLDSFASLGVNILTDSTLRDVEADEDGVYGTVGDAEVFGDILLVATGRRPNVHGLGLEAIGIVADNAGIPVDAQCRASTANIFAVGDVTRGSPRLANWATMQGLVAAKTIAGIPASCNESVASCVFTDPEIAVAGLTETTAARAGIEVRAEKSSFAWNGRALAEGEARGFAKKLFAKEDGRLVGVEIVGPHASELIAQVSAEICGETPPPHPTWSESLFTLP